MVKILLFSDLHLRVNDSLGVIRDGENSRLQDKRKTLKQITDIAIKEQVDLVCDLGDTYDSINPSDKLRLLYAEGFQGLNDVSLDGMSACIPNIKFIRVLGNHETDGKVGAGEDTAIWTYRNGYNVIVRPQRQVLNNLEILFIPEVSNDKVIEALEKYPDALVLGHFGIQGADYGTGKKDESGILLKHIVNRKQPVRLGHYHKRQRHYIGAICRANFGDKDITTGVTVMTFDDANKLIDEKYIEVEDRSLIEIKFHEESSQEKRIENLITAVTNMAKDAIIKLRYYGSSEWFQSQDVKSTVKQYYDIGASKVIVDFNMLNSEVKELEEVDTNFNFKDLISKKAQEDKQDESIGLKYLNKASEL